MVATWATLCWRETEIVQSTPVFDSCKRSLAPVYTHLNYSPTSNHSYQLWLNIENNVTGWLISSGSGASALCTGELHTHSLVDTQWTSLEEGHVCTATAASPSSSVQISWMDCFSSKGQKIQRGSCWLELATVPSWGRCCYFGPI